MDCFNSLSIDIKVTSFIISLYPKPLMYYQLRSVLLNCMLFITLDTPTFKSHCLSSVMLPICINLGYQSDKQGKIPVQIHKFSYTDYWRISFTVYLFILIGVRRRTAVTRHWMICLVLLYIYIYNISL